LSSPASVMRWLALALLGLAIAAAVAFAASRLVSQRIGLASQPLNAGRELAPPAARRPEHRHRGSGSGPAPTVPGPAPTTTAPTTIAPPATTIVPPTTGGSEGDGGSGADDQPLVSDFGRVGRHIRG
jgi:hypothetical protein